jgi:hypothetical protein
MPPERVKFMPSDSPGEWKEGERESPRETHRDPFERQTADVRDDNGDLHKNVTITRK